MKTHIGSCGLEASINMEVKTLELNDGEFVGIGALEITSIPTLSILRDNYPKELTLKTNISRDSVTC
jgi:hypothetical protein